MLKNFQKINKGIILEPTTIVEADAQKGALYYDQADDKLKVSVVDGAVTELTTGADLADYFKKDGSVAATGDFDLDGNDIVNVSSVTSAFAITIDSGDTLTLTGNNDVILTANGIGQANITGGSVAVNTTSGHFNVISSANASITATTAAEVSGGSLQLASSVAGIQLTSNTDLQVTVNTDTTINSANVNATASDEINLVAANNLTLDSTSGVVLVDSVLSVNNNKITNLANPTLATDGANKGYVDAVAEGLKPKQAVKVSTQTNVDLSTELEASDVLDGVTLVAGDRVLVRAQTTASQNGVYVVQATGPAVRATDFDSLAPIDEINGATVAVQEGSDAGKVFVQTGQVATIGSDPINFIYFTSAINYVAGNGINITGNTISAKIDGTTLLNTIDGLAVNALAFPESLIPAVDTNNNIGDATKRMLNVHTLVTNTNSVKFVDDSTSGTQRAFEVCSTLTVAAASNSDLFLGAVAQYGAYEVSLRVTDAVTGHVQMAKALIAVKTNAANSSVVVTSTETGLVDAVYTLTDSGANINLNIASTNGVSAVAKILKIT